MSTTTSKSYPVFPSSSNQPASSTSTEAQTSDPSQTSTSSSVPDPAPDGTTSSFLQNFNLVAEAVKRAQMAVLLRDMGDLDVQ